MTDEQIVRLIYPQALVEKASATKDQYCFYSNSSKKHLICVNDGPLKISWEVFRKKIEKNYLISLNLDAKQFVLSVCVGARVSNFIGGYAIYTEEGPPNTFHDHYNLVFPTEQEAWEDAAINNKLKSYYIKKITKGLEDKLIKFSNSMDFYKLANSIDHVAPKAVNSNNLDVNFMSRDW